MRKYAFKFESLLNVRNLQEESAEREFKEAMLAYQEELEKLDGYRSQFQQSLEDCAEQQRNGFDIRIQHLYDAYFKRLKTEISQQTETVNKAEAHMEKQREALMEAMKERKVVEKLKVRDYEKYMEELKRWEQSIIDDLSVLRENSEQAASRAVR